MWEPLVIAGSEEGAPPDKTGMGSHAVATACSPLQAGVSAGCNQDLPGGHDEAGFYSRSLKPFFAHNARLPFLTLISTLNLQGDCY